MDNALNTPQQATTATDFIETIIHDGTSTPVETAAGLASHSLEMLAEVNARRKLFLTLKDLVESSFRLLQRFEPAPQLKCAATHIKRAIEHVKANRYVEAKKAYVQAYEILKGVLGHNHPDLVSMKKYINEI